VANNIKLIEEHVKQRLKQLMITADDDADAWHEFEKKYTSINVAQHSASKVKSNKSETKTEFNISKQTTKWILLAISCLVLAIAAYFVWPYIASFKTTTPPALDSSLIVKPAPPVIKAPPMQILMDTVKKDSIKVPVSPNSMPTTTVKPPITNTTTVPIVNRPRQDAVKSIDTKQKEEKKAEGEFDFFDKPAAGNDSLRIY
jgi:hypothetical protein